MQQPAAIHALRRIVAASDDAEAAECLAVLDAILAGADPRSVLGLGRAAMRDKCRQRDALICDLAARHFKHLNSRRAAIAIFDAWTRYRRRRLDADKRLPDMPSTYCGTHDEYFFQLGRMVEELPGHKQLENIIKNGNEYSVVISILTAHLDIKTTNRKVSK